MNASCITDGVHMATSACCNLLQWRSHLLKASMHMPYYVSAALALALAGSLSAAPYLIQAACSDMGVHAVQAQCSITSSSTAAGTAGATGGRPAACNATLQRQAAGAC